MRYRDYTRLFFKGRSACRYGAFHLFVKTPRDDPTKFPPHRHRYFGMGSAETRKYQTTNNHPTAEACASSTRYTFLRTAPPSTSLYRKRKLELQTGAMAYTMATEQRIIQLGGRNKRKLLHNSRCWREIVRQQTVQAPNLNNNLHREEGHNGFWTDSSITAFKQG